jgi:hypothetical protein
VPTLVEVKRSSDTRARREVVAQMLDYAANAVVYWPVETIRGRFEARCEREGTDPDQALAEIIDAAIEPASFWQSVESNLLAGRIRMIFVADRIAPELQRIVEFLNGQMRPAEVLAVELRQYAHEGESTIVPRIIGQTTEAEQRKQIGPKSAGVWTEESVLEHMRERAGDAAATAAETIIAWAKQSGLRIESGKGALDGSLQIRSDTVMDGRSLIILYTYGSAEFQLLYIRTFAPFNTDAGMAELLDRVRAIPGIDAAMVETRTRPSIKLPIVAEDSALRYLLSTMDWILAQLAHPAANHA